MSKGRFVYLDIHANDEAALCRKLDRVVGKEQRVISIKCICPRRAGGFFYGVYVENPPKRKGDA